eukprot:TRINITY_DN909_c0_g1_i3.p1 TRINITY_DN909_c0_g1~~TRINITY_DN909_c0_g1_i3.p1  ORF type:complete len:218 (-),score=9.63 TRINITY_DN909_c0_g1_i3:64-717(-)
MLRFLTIFLTILSFGFCVSLATNGDTLVNKEPTNPDAATPLSYFQELNATVSDLVKRGGGGDCRNDQYPSAPETCTSCSTLNRMPGDGNFCGVCVEGFFHNATGLSYDTTPCTPCSVALQTNILRECTRLRDVGYFTDVWNSGYGYGTRFATFYKSDITECSKACIIEGFNRDIDLSTLVTSFYYGSALGTCRCETGNTPNTSSSWKYMFHTLYNFP